MKPGRWASLFATALLGGSLATGAYASSVSEPGSEDSPAQAFWSLPLSFGSDLAEAAGLDGQSQAQEETKWEDVQGGMKTMSGQMLELGGRVEGGFHDPENQNSTFYLYWIQLDMVGRFTEDISFHGTVGFEPSEDNSAVAPFSPFTAIGDTVSSDKLDVDEAYFQIDNLLHHVGIPDPTGAFLVAGVKHHPQWNGFAGHFPGRYNPLIQPSLTATQFFRDEDQGLWAGVHPLGPIGGPFADIIAVVSLTNGNEIGLRGAGIAPNNNFVGSPDPLRTVVIADREVDFDNSDSEEIGGFLGVPFDLGESCGVDGLGHLTLSTFYRDSKIEGQELGTLLFALGPPPGTSFDKDRFRTGGSLEWNAGTDDRCHFLYEYVYALDSDLQRDSNSVEASYAIPIPGGGFEYKGRKFLSSIEPAGRFSWTNIDLDGAFANALGPALPPGAALAAQFLVDRQVGTLGLNFHVSENVSFITQYSWFDEKGFHGADLDNNEWGFAFRAAI